MLGKRQTKILTRQFTPVGSLLTARREWRYGTMTNSNSKRNFTS
jgi:hypothetical protein